MTLVEREAELDRVTQILHQAATGSGVVTVVRGPLGIGKSMLLNQIDAQAEAVGALVLRASAAPSEMEFAGGVVHQLFESELTSASGTPWPAWPDPASFDELHMVVRDLTGRAPLVILVDDLQWADQPSLVFLARLCRRISGLRAVVVVSLLDGDERTQNPVITEIQAAAEDVLRLKPLSQNGVRTLLTELHGRPVDEQCARKWLQRTGGNPMLVNALPADPDSTQPPVRLTGVLGRCLRAQHHRVRAMAEALAVMGSPTETELVRQVADLDEVDASEAIRSLRALGLLTPGPQLGFAAPILHSALRWVMTVADSKRVKQRAAEVLYEVGSVEQVACHLADMTPPVAEWAVDTLRAAATAAMTKGEARLAVKYLRRALVAGSYSSADRGRLLAELAAAELDHDLAASVRHVHRAVPLLPSARERASALCAMPVTMLPNGHVGLDLIRSAAAELGDPAGLSGTDRDLALRLEARLRLAGNEDPIQLADANERLYTLCPQLPMDTPGDRELAAALLYCGVLAGKTAPDEVARLGNRILANEPGAATRSYTPLSVMTTTLLAVESVRELELWLDAAAEDAQRHTMKLPLALIRARQALVHQANGRLLEARDLAERTIAEADPTWLEVITNCAIVLCGVAVELRDQALAKRTLQRCLLSAEKFQLSVMIGLLRGSAALTSGQLPAAVEHFADLGRHLERIGWRNSALFHWRARLVTLHARLGNTQLATELSEQNLEEARATGVAGPIGKSLRLCGALTTGPRSVALLHEAVDALTPSINTVELAKAHALLGRRLQETGDESAITHLHKAHKLATASGLTWLAERTNLPVRGQQPPPNDHQAADLTATERLVVDLVAEGHRNKEIADSLGVGPRTVEKHLTRVYRKLGVSGRSDLLDLLREPGNGSPTG